MSQSLLTFDDEDHEFAPAADRTAPAFYIRRLVVFNLHDGETEPIRDVEFKLGLNIINTAAPDPNKDGAVGHDVGKTLLTRLIRYCLGETNYGKKRTRTGDELNNHLLGHLTRLEIHHVFPKALLYKAGFKKRRVNAIANFTFLTQETNLEVSKRDPTEYLPHYEKKNPGSIETHWLPMDPELWKIENYVEFLAERRRLLASAANEFLEKLASGHVPEPVAVEQSDFISQVTAYVPGSVDSDEEEARLNRCQNWVVNKGLPEGQMEFELTDDNGNQLAFLDLAWPDGLQPGLTQPVAVLIDESNEVKDAASYAGFRCFSSPMSFRRYVREEILGDELEEEDAAEFAG